MTQHHRQINRIPPYLLSPRCDVPGLADHKTAVGVADFQANIEGAAADVGVDDLGAVKVTLNAPGIRAILSTCRLDIPAPLSRSVLLH